MSSTSIAYLAPRGTYSDEAARIFAQKMGATEVEFVGLPSFNEIYEAVERGRCEFGVMPIENSLEGAVTATLDAFAFRSGCCIVGSTIIDIHHCLFLNPEASIDDVTTVASHPQALGQCRRYLNEHFPRLRQVSSKSTADGIRMAAEDKHVAGIGSAYAGGLFECKTELEGIEDHFGNQTKFVLVARTGHPQALKGSKMKTSLALFLENDRPGALQMILSEFNYANVNLTMIQSRPTKQGLGDYMFFIDIEGSQDDLAVRTALDCLRLKLREVKILGSYPTE
ncbi:MAG: prephenate dehydratase [Coriobacteriia bacterium]|nr:prephenate dehydratase [Coriobacteriia bacterium]